MQGSVICAPVRNGAFVYGRNWCVWQKNGVSCGPENTGPVTGWFWSSSLSLPAPLALASSRLFPGVMPVTRPTRPWPVGAGANWPVTSTPFRLTRTSANRVPGGATTCTSASPPLTLSGRFDSVRICSLLSASAGAVTTRVSATSATLRQTSTRRLRIPTRTVFMWPPRVSQRSSLVAVVVIVALAEVEPGAGQRPLFDSALGVVADALGEDRPQPTLLRRREVHGVALEVDRTEAALQDVAPECGARSDAHGSVDRIDRVAHAGGVQRERLLVPHARRVPAGVLERRRLVADHLDRVRVVRGVGEDLLEPRVVGDERHPRHVRDDSGARRQPVDLVRGRSVRPLEPIEEHESPDAGVDVGVVVPVVTRIDDRERQVLPRRDDSAGAVGELDPLETSFRALRHDVAVDVEAADLLVEVQELLLRDVAGVQGVEAVLDADVVVRGARKAGVLVDAEDVDLPVPERGTDTGGIGDGIVTDGERHDGIEAGGGILPAVGEAAPPVLAHGVAGRDPGRDRIAVHLAAAAARPGGGVGDGVEVVVEDSAVEDVDHDRGDVRVRDARGQRVEETGVVVGDQVLLDGAARPAGADRELGDAVLLDEALLDHHQRLGGDDVVA